MNDYKMSKTFKNKLIRLGIITIVPSLLVFSASYGLTTSIATGSNADTQGWAFIFLVFTPLVWIIIPLFFIFLHSAKKEARLETNRAIEQGFSNDDIPDEHSNLSLTYAIASLSLYSFYFCIPALIHGFKAKDNSKRGKKAMTIAWIMTAFLILALVLTSMLNDMFIDFIKSL